MRTSFLSATGSLEKLFYVFSSVIFLFIIVYMEHFSQTAPPSSRPLASIRVRRQQLLSNTHVTLPLASARLRDDHSALRGIARFYESRVLLYTQVGLFTACPRADTFCLRRAAQFTTASTSYAAAPSPSTPGSGTEEPAQGFPLGRMGKASPPRTLPPTYQNGGAAASPNSPAHPTHRHIPPPRAAGRSREGLPGGAPRHQAPAPPPPRALDRHFRPRGRRAPA